MRRKFILIVAAILALVFAACFATACDPTPKEVTLHFYRGGIGDDAQITGLSGADISDQLPTPNSTQAYYFGGWYDNEDLEGEAVTIPTEMPAESKSYYARWYRKYSVNFYVQDAQSKEYAKAETLSFEVNKGVDNVTVSVADFQKYAIYKNVTEQGDSVELHIDSRDGGVVDLKFDLIYRNVTYILGEGEGERVTVQAINGYELDLSGDNVDVEKYKRSGKRLSGFSFSSGGEPINSLTVFEDIELYALWDLAYIERNGSNDLLYVKDDKAYLLREAVEELEGTYDADTRMFSFLDGALVGRVYDDGTFAMQREKFDFKMYDNNTQSVADSVILSLDGLDGATLTVIEDGDLETLVYVDEEMVKLVPSVQEFLHMYVPLSVPQGEHKGSYRMDANFADIALTLNVPIADGVSIQMQLHFKLGTYENKDLSWTDVFVLRGEEFGIYSDDIADILLDGYGEAYYILSDGRYTIGRYVTVFYEENNDLGLPTNTEYAAVFSTGTVYFEQPEFMVQNADGIPSAEIYRYDDLYGAYEEFVEDESSNPETYVFSGYGYAYKDGERYTYVLENGDTMSTYLLRFVSVYDAEDDFVMKALIDEAYGGYYKMTNKDAMAYPLTDFASMTELITIDGENAIYFYSDGQGGLYYTDGKITKFEDSAGGVTMYRYTDNYPIDENDVFTFFMLETDGIITCYREDTPVYNGTFKGERGESITMDGFGNAHYVAADGSVHDGRYINYSEDGDGVMGFLCDNDYCSTQFLFSIEGDKFKPYVEELTEALALSMVGYAQEGLVIYSNVSMTIDDKNAAVLTITVNDKVLQVKGSVELYDAQNYYYSFKVTSVEGDKQMADDWGISSDFIFMRSMIPVSSETSEYGYEYVDVFMLSDGFEGEYDIEGQTLSIDGFGYGAFLGESGEYELMTDGKDGNRPHYVIAFYDVQGHTYFFDVAPDGTLTVRGNEFIMEYYFMMTDDGAVNILLMPDGRGNLDIALNLDEEPYNGLYSMAVGKYYVDENRDLHAYDVEYTEWKVMEGFTKDECDMLNSYALILQLAYGLNEQFDFTLYSMDIGSSYGDDYFFQIRDAELCQAYVLNDYDVLILDGFYTATYIDRYGEKIEREYTVTKYRGTNEQDEEYIVSVVRIESEDLAFYIDPTMGAAHIGWEYGNYYLGDDIITLNGMRDDKSCVSYTSDGTEKVGTYTVDTNLMICTADFEDGSKLVFRVFVETGEYIICDDGIVGDYTCVDKEGSELGDTLHMDGLGRATITKSDGSWDRYDVEEVSCDIFELTNYYNANDTLTVKLFKADGANTYRVSDGQMIEEELPKFDFLKGAILDDSKPLSIDSFDIVYIGDEAIGQVTSVENPEGEWMAIYHVTLNDGTETGFCRFRAYKFDMGNVNFYTQYDAQTAATFTDSDGSAFPLYLTGYGIGMREGNSPENENRDSYNAIYWFEDGKLHVDDLWIGNTGGEKIYTLNYEDHTFVLSKENIKADFVVEDGVLVAYLGRNPNVIIPTDMGIKEIGDNVFSVKNSSYQEGSLDFILESIDLSGVVEIIGESAFRGMLSNLNLSSITGTQNVKVIKDNAFYCTGISEIDLPNIVEIGYQGFYGSKSLGMITLGNESTVWNEAGIGEKAFMGSINVAEGVVNFNAPHVPKLGAKAFNAGTTKKRTINFKFKSAYDEAMDSSTAIGATWKEFVDATNVTFVDLESQAAAGASLEGNSPELYFEDKRAA